MGRAYDDPADEWAACREAEAEARDDAPVPDDGDEDYWEPQAASL